MKTDLDLWLDYQRSLASFQAHPGYLSRERCVSAYSLFVREFCPGNEPPLIALLERRLERHWPGVAA